MDTSLTRISNNQSLPIDASFRKTLAFSEIKYTTIKCVFIIYRARTGPASINKVRSNYYLHRND